MVTVALRRADLTGEQDPFANILEFIDSEKFLLLPNTSGAMNAENLLRILQEVDRPNFTHILDTGQYKGSPGSSGQRGKEDPSYNFYGSIEETAPLAVHVRCKIYRIQNGTEEWLNYPRIFEILKGVDYNGMLSVVYEGQDVEEEATAIPKAVSYLRGLMAAHEA